MENGLETELDDQLGYSRNGHSSKTLRTSFGDGEVSVFCEQRGEFAPKLLRKSQSSISQDIEEKILPMDAKDMTTGDIGAHIQDIYGVEVSDATVSRSAGKDPTHRKRMAAAAGDRLRGGFSGCRPPPCSQRGTNYQKGRLPCHRHQLRWSERGSGMWAGKNENAKCWAIVLNRLKNLVVEGIFLACTDNLTSFSAAIEAAFPRTENQNCIIQQI